MTPRVFKKAVDFLSATPLHPQWLMRGDKHRFMTALSNTLKGTVLDIGCSDKSSAVYLEAGAEYVGLDYTLTSTPYGSRPDVYARAESLPFAGGSMDAVLLLDVLEHVEDPGACMREVARVLSPGGRLVLAVPFLYPMHDVPYDYRRWTRYGLSSLLAGHGLIIDSTSAPGGPLTTTGLLANLALCRLALASIDRRHPGIILFLLLPVLVPCINIAAYLVDLALPRDEGMPYRYHVLATRKTEEETG